MESKKIAEMNTIEKFELFKEEIISSIVSKFRGGKIEQMPMLMFLGVKHSAINSILKNDPDSVQDVNGDKWDGKLAEENKIHIVPIPVENAMNNEFLNIMGKSMWGLIDREIDKLGKISAANMVHNAIRNFRKHDINAVMFSVHISESYVYESSVTQKERLQSELNGEPLYAEKEIQKHIQSGKSLKELDGVTEKVTFMFEHKTETHMVMFDIERDVENGFQFLKNRKDHPNSGKGEGVFMNFVYESSVSNSN